MRCLFAVRPFSHAAPHLKAKKLIIFKPLADQIVRFSSGWDLRSGTTYNTQFYALRESVCRER